MFRNYSLEIIKNFQQLGKENASNLSFADPGLCCLINFVHDRCEMIIKKLNEQHCALDSSADESASVISAMKI